MTRLDHQLVSDLRDAARRARDRDVVRACRRFLNSEATDDDRRKLAAACWPLLGREVSA